MPRTAERFRPENPREAFAETLAKKAEKINKKQERENPLFEKLHQEYEVAVFNRAISVLPTADEKRGLRD